MKTFEWMTVENECATVGITPEAVAEIGEIVFIELPKVGSYVEKEQEIVVLESTKAAIDLYSPISGTVIEVNQQVKNDLSLINTQAGSAGWLYKIKTTDHHKKG